MSTLSPDQMMKMQSIMHNTMAGFDVTREMTEFESSLPPHFKLKMAQIMSQNPIQTAAAPTPTNESEARLIILQSVAQGLMSPAEALKVLFPE